MTPNGNDLIVLLGLFMIIDGWTVLLITYHMFAEQMKTKSSKS